jgi:hypothetical protein
MTLDEGSYHNSINRVGEHVKKKKKRVGEIENLRYNHNSTFSTIFSDTLSSIG